ncbi:MAG: Mur ligase domain-containing protein, partial [Bacteroidaceae bacterium]
MSYSIDSITKLIGAKRIGEKEAQIDWLLTDSRSLCFPEETLFFALKSKRSDGRKYVDELYARGVRNFVVSNLPEDIGKKDANYLVVSNPLKALQK